MERESQKSPGPQQPCIGREYVSLEWKMCRVRVPVMHVPPDVLSRSEHTIHPAAQSGDRMLPASEKSVL